MTGREQAERQVQGKENEEGITKNDEQRKENKFCKSMSELCTPVVYSCLCKIPVRQQKQRLVIVFPGYRQAWQIKAVSRRDTERNTAACFGSYGSRGFLIAVPPLP